MNNNYRFQLEKGGKKYLCPQCNKKTFVRYFDLEDESLIPFEYGRCDREINCGYHLNPYKDNYLKTILNTNKEVLKNIGIKRYTNIKTATKSSKTTFIPKETLFNTLKGYSSNVFLQNLLSKVAYPFNTEDISKIISMYYLGTIQKGYRTGGITFPFIDCEHNIRTIQVKQFDNHNHTTGTDFLHSMIEKDIVKNKQQLPEWLVHYKANNLKVSCLFGEHLLNKYPNNPIALVEAPKSAIYGTLYFGFPEQDKNLLWLAVYNLSSLNYNKCKVLKGRDVYLFPDTSKNGNAYQLWNKAAEQIQTQLANTTFKVSTLLENLASENDKQKGKDIADYLITQDWQLYR
ncbi:DUF6371 domain-containing protein [Myroides marinus]|uniref:DUF6371 domain-containing protein n=1 Tax=Myroides marinus TaxID=703342 RepID=UPI0025755DC1|nr:DUF6371 domain-containing protein [Myroides marinus]MDM1534224.1 hypothetical protein [Myroides marinus]MDM1541188.1 hypothetical protein [Myroides marinus]